MSAAKFITITARAKDGSGVYGQYEVTIAPPADTIIISHDDVNCNNQILLLDLLTDDKTIQIVANIAPDDAGQAVTWRSSDNYIATVSDTGLITGKSRGTVTITVTAADGTKVRATCNVKVTNLAKEINITGKATLAGGKRTTLKAEVLPKQTSNKIVMWESSDTDIATINEDGVITAKAVTEAKTVTITATAKRW